MLDDEKCKPVSKASLGAGKIQAGSLGPKGDESAEAQHFSLDQFPRRGRAKLRLSRGFTLGLAPTTSPPQILGPIN
jgi:hypothetical protein